MMDADHLAALNRGYRKRDFTDGTTAATAGTP